MLGALIGAGASLLGIGAAKDAQKQQARIAEQNRQDQIMFAQKGIQWRAEDAKAAGISKLYALGANTASYSPVSVGGSQVPSAISAAGQNIGRAVDATAGHLGRAGHFATDIAQTQLEGLKIDNEIKRADLLSKLNLRNQPGTPPAYPLVNDETIPIMDGQGNAKIRLQRNLTPAGNEPNRSFGVNPEVDMWRTKHGYAPEVPQELGEAHESQPLAAFQWFARNKIMPGFDEAWKTYPYEPPEGMYWKFNPIFGQYTLEKRGGRFDWIPGMSAYPKEWRD